VVCRKGEERRERCSYEKKKNKRERIYGGVISSRKGTAQRKHTVIIKSTFKQAKVKGQGLPKCETSDILKWGCGTGQKPGVPRVTGRKATEQQGETGTWLADLK